jgi:queuine tRNA-ribosyltransferase
MISYPNFSFKISHTDKKSRARVGKLKTPHGTIDTPNYIFCATKAAIKGLSPDQMREAGAQIILSNTYHTMIQPGADLIERMGGLHEFMQWRGPMLTDSGGFQVFSMYHGYAADEVKGRGRPKREQSLMKIDEVGAVFRSYTDGAAVTLTPEIAMQVQRKLGADLLMQFDECTPYHATRDYTARSMEMSMRWGDRCLQEFERTHDGAQAVYGIVQGGAFEDLRKTSADYVADRPFFGTAIGGCLGGTDEEMANIAKWSLYRSDETRPVHFLGIGQIKDVFKFVRLGVDTFDCVIPTRLARHGAAFMQGVPGETINLKNARYRNDPEPLDARNAIPASRDFSKGYIHHLLKSDEILGVQILAQHNVATITRLMTEIRTAIGSGTLNALEKKWIA